MLRMLKLFISLIAYSLRSRLGLLMEILALRQQFTILKAQHPRPRLTALDRVFLDDVATILEGVEARLPSPNRRQLSLDITPVQTVLNLVLAAGHILGTVKNHTHKLLKIKGKFWCPERDLLL